MLRWETAIGGRRGQVARLVLRCKSLIRLICCLLLFQITQVLSAIYDITYHLDGTDLVLKGRANATGRAKIHLKKGGGERGLVLR